MTALHSRTTCMVSQEGVGFPTLPNLDHQAIPKLMGNWDLRSKQSLSDHREVNSKELLFNRDLLRADHRFC
ncbi:hypothetical protein Nepgr_022566 [Nepenthes gracilis]|uniref:Uncharacterized protein n=1 Tax=Nepenthes gracilis TaxID=150966 RepID=A0AAD3T0Z9_NEPGR|nr:hypothetical protein Nepgr_022566 [Nepenthes gracilis]